MLYTSSADVTIPAHRFSQFKKALIRHAPTEHIGIELGNVTAYVLRREGANAIVRVLIDSTVDHSEIGGFAEQWETEGSRSAANESIGFAIGKVDGEWGYYVDTERAE